MTHKRLEIEGYLFMGEVKVPPLPNFIVLTDRVTGTLYWLSRSGSSVTLSTTIPATPDTTTYGPYDGPYIADGELRWRLYVSSGILAVEASADLVSSAPVAARDTTNTIVLVTAPAGVLTYEAVEL